MRNIFPSAYVSYEQNIIFESENLYNASTAIDGGSSHSDERLLEMLFKIDENPKLYTNYEASLNMVEAAYFNNMKLTKLPVSISLLKNVSVIDLSHNELCSLPEDFTKLKNLQNLDLSSNLLLSLPENFSSLSELQVLNISANPISILPEDIGKISKLRKLCLDFTNIKHLPESLLELNAFTNNQIKFYINEFHTGIYDFGIFLSDDRIQEPPVEILQSNNLKLIRGWYSQEKYDEVLHEGKVIFLGDGGVGKTYTIKRMKENGKAGNYSTVATPGIGIEDIDVKIENYSLENNFTLHLWDFGGQAIMRSMHRAFLTRQTAYVVIISNRNSNLYTQARYWLKNIESFAPDSPVLLAVNHWENIPGTFFDEDGLMEEFTNLKEIIHYTATIGSETEFCSLIQAIENLTIRLNDQNKSLIPTGWNKVRKELINMKQPYINQYQYHEICDRYKINPELRSSLLEWYNNLGICFSYHLDPKNQKEVSDYKILQPQWLTNAIYIIINCGVDDAQNGILRKKDIRRLLKNPKRSVLENIKYEEDEIDYILDIMRKFHLSYPTIDEKEEFIPALCADDRRPVGLIPKKYALHAGYELSYHYLPDSVLHQLMIACYPDLNTHMLWSRGMRIDVKYLDLTAIVTLSNDDEHLQIDLYSNSVTYNQIILNTIRKHILEANKLLNVNVYKECMILFDGKYTAKADLASILHAQRANIPVIVNFESSHQSRIEHVSAEEIWSTIFSEEVVRLSEFLHIEEENQNISVESIFRAIDYLKNNTEINIGDVMAAKKLAKDILSSLGLIQDDIFNVKGRNENGINKLLQNYLSNLGYQIKDQTLVGESFNRKGQGELDLLIWLPNSSEPFAILEALKLKSFAFNGQNILKDHITKTLDQYNPRGLRYLYVVIYSYKKDLALLWKEIGECIAAYSIPDIYDSYSGVLLPIDTIGAEQKAAKMILKRNKEDVTLYIIAATMPLDEALEG